MKKLNSFLFITSNFLLLTSLLIFGCQQKNISKVSDSVNSGEESASFTEVWREQGNRWSLNLGADGNIPEVNRPEGLHMVLSEGGILKDSPNKEIFVRYIYGDCFWSYDSESNILKATVTLDNYYVNASGAELSCGMVDEFEGPVSPDKMIWTANWTTITTFDTNIPAQTNTGRTLIFDKMPHPAHE